MLAGVPGRADTKDRPATGHGIEGREHLRQQGGITVGDAAHDRPQLQP
jgi:hypothetical protein